MRKILALLLIVPLACLFPHVCLFLGVIACLGWIAFDGWIAREINREQARRIQAERERELSSRERFEAWLNQDQSKTPH